MPKFLQQIDLTNNKLVNLADPSAATDATTKQYVDNLVNGLAFKDEVQCATTTNGTLATAYAAGQVIDGYTLVLADRILLKNQTTQSENGIYVVTAGAPTRATDFDAGSEWKQATVRVVDGTTNKNTQWTCNNTGSVTFGTTAITFVTSGGGVSYTAGNGLGLSTNTFSVTPNGSSLDVSPSGVKIADAAAGNGLTSASGILSVGAGTGITVGADTVGIDTSVVVRKYAASIGNGSLTTLAVTHSLGSRDITWCCYDASTYEVVYPNATITDANTLTLSFASAPASNAYRVVVQS